MLLWQIFTTVVVLTALVANLNLVWKLERKIRKLTRQLAGYQQSYGSFRYRIGATTLWQNQSLSYKLWSPDEGKTWYALDPTRDDFVILGPVDEIYPGLLPILISLDELVQHAQTHGPIRLDDSDPEGEQLLPKAGFTITDK